MVQVVSSTDPSSQAFLATDAETDPFAGMPFSGVGEEAAGASSGEIESLASDVITQLKTLSPETEAAIATSLSELFASVADQLNTVDLNDPAAVADLQASLSGIMALSLGETPTPEIDLLSGIADNANAALTLAAADPTAGGTAIELVTSQYTTFSDSFASAAAGTSDFATTVETTLEGLFSLYMSLIEMGAASGVSLTSLALAESPSLDSPETEPTDMPVDLLPDEGSSEVDDLLGDFGLDPEEPVSDALTSEEDFGLDDLLADDSLDPAEPTDLSTSAGEETTEMDDLLEEFSLDPEDTGEIDPMTDEPTENPEDAAAGLSKDSSTDGDPSAENQEVLEARYIGLYESLMEKQIAFKEAIEPYKTDNQNAGKG